MKKRISGILAIAVVFLFSAVAMAKPVVFEQVRCNREPAVVPANTIWFPLYIAGIDTGKLVYVATVRNTTENEMTVCIKWQTTDTSGNKINHGVSGGRRIKGYQSTLVKVVLDTPTRAGQYQVIFELQHQKTGALGVSPAWNWQQGETRDESFTVVAHGQPVVSPPLSPSLGKIRSAKIPYEPTSTETAILATAMVAETLQLIPAFGMVATILSPASDVVRSRMGPSMLANSLYLKTDISKGSGERQITLDASVGDVRTGQSNYPFYHPAYDRLVIVVRLPVGSSVPDQPGWLITETQESVMVTGIFDGPGKLIGRFGGGKFHQPRMRLRFSDAGVGEGKHHVHVVATAMIGPFGAEAPAEYLQEATLRSNPSVSEDAGMIEDAWRYDYAKWQRSPENVTWYTMAVRSSKAAMKVKKQKRPDLHIVAVVDSSGSMSRTDPHDLRIEALHLLLDALAENHALGIVDFSGEARVLARPKTLGPMGGSAREKLRQAIGKIKARGKTNIRDALIAAIEASPGKADDFVLILLSDGGDNSPHNWKGEANFIPPGVPVHVIALSEMADMDSLSQLAQASDGIMEVANTAGDLHRIFSTLFEVVEKRQLLLVREGLLKTGEQVIHDLFFEPGVYGAEFRITWPGSDIDMVIRDPSGRNYSVSEAVQSGFGAKGRTYNIVRIDDVPAGQWHVQVDGVDLNPSGETYHLRVSAAETPLNAEWALTPEIPQAGKGLHLSIRADEVIWEQARINLWRPDGSTDNESVALQNIGALLSGENRMPIYTLHPYSPGAYRLMVEIQGKSKSGHPVVRSFDRTFNIAKECADAQRESDIKPLIPRNR